MNNRVRFYKTLRERQIRYRFQLSKNSEYRYTIFLKDGKNIPLKIKVLFKKNIYKSVSDSGGNRINISFLELTDFIKNKKFDNRVWLKTRI